MENLLIMRLKATEHTFGLTYEAIQVNGRITKCMVMVFTNGQMVDNSKVITSMIRSMGKVLSLGKMDENTKDFGA